MYPKGGIKTLSLETVLPKKATLGGTVTEKRVTV